MNSVIKSILRVSFLFILIAILCLAIFIIYLIIENPRNDSSDVNFGVTFSQVFTEDMGLDWQKTYLSILDDLGVNKIRLIAYWPRIEPEQGKYSFKDLDWQVDQAGKRGVEIILAMGRKVPRWPECHIPNWANNLSEQDQQEKILSMFTEIVNHYQGNDAIKILQIENEPFLKGFGICPKLDKDFLDKEIALVRELDFDRRPIMVTASGELSSWIKPAIRADAFGTTLYRIVWNKRFGYLKYPLPPIFYQARAKIVKWVTQIDKMVIIELQAEPWGPVLIYKAGAEENSKSMDLEKFKGIIDYTYKTGFDEAYFWGVEWWYWLKEVEGDDSIWLEAKKLWD
ncbi:MAG: cellulase family glycosylhydrolase [bacterium]